MSDFIPVSGSYLTELGGLLEAREASDGYRLSRRLSHFSLSRYIFDTNLAELLRHLDSFEGAVTHEEALELMRAREEFDAFLREAARLLANLLSAATAVYDHGKSIVKKSCAAKHELRAENKIRLMAARDMPLVAFVQRLRNVIAHEESMAPEGRIVFLVYRGRREGSGSFVHLPRARLQDYAESRPKEWITARQFLDRQAEHIIVRDVLCDYGRHVADYCDWLEARLQEEFASDLADLARREAEIARHRLA